jgi:hypothetical protein
MATKAAHISTPRSTLHNLGIAVSSAADTEWDIVAGYKAGANPVLSAMRIEANTAIVDRMTSDLIEEAKARIALAS